MKNCFILVCLVLLLSPAFAWAGQSKERVLVAYFSATGRTRAVAEQIAKECGADIFEITPSVPYLDADLNYNDKNSRCVKEHNNPKLRPEIAKKIPALAKYDRIFIGYPIWWGEAPNIVYTFLEAHDFSGKQLVPFCTSHSSPLGKSDVKLHAFAPKAIWHGGKCFDISYKKADVSAWLLNLKKK